MIEDEDMLRTTARLMLRDLGYEVLCAADGPEGIEIFKNNTKSIDVIFLDMVMPKMNGLTTYKALREIDSAVKVVFTSGLSQEGIIPAEAAGFIIKPYRRYQLSEAIERALHKKPIE